MYHCEKCGDIKVDADRSVSLAGAPPKMMAVNLLKQNTSVRIEDALKLTFSTEGGDMEALYTLKGVVTNLSI